LQRLALLIEQEIKLGVSLLRGAGVKLN